ncbi:ead/Ea22-like family protein [Raoultella planticola]|uniref:ead/Ea22-like family protein n=1 Tax=Raoultella planticola TaxID=575 RepID=UPI003A4E2541
MSSMTTDITELAQRMKAAAEKATQGEWWADEVKNEGCYGSGDDCVEGFTSYAIYGSDGQTLFDSLNSDAACICEEYDGEGHVAWDETAQRNAEFIALANPANILALVEALEKSEKTSEARREAIDITHKRAARERDRANAAEEALERAQAVLVNDGTIGKPLTIILPDISSKAFWSGAGRTETFHPGTYRRWVREAIERYCAIARIDVEVI